MERYEKELRTGHLNWGLLHTDKFWKENVRAFESKEFELIRYAFVFVETCRDDCLKLTNTVKMADMENLLCAHAAC